MGRDAELADLAAQAGHQPDHAVAAGDGARPRGAGPAAVAVHHDIGGEHGDEAVHVAAPDRAEEPRGEFLPLAP